MNFGNYNYQPYGYQQQFPQVQQFQPQGLTGKVVNTFDEVTANDVPMNSPFAIFYKSDGTELQVRSWTAQGTISTRTFKACLDAKVCNDTSETESSPYGAYNALRKEVNERFDKIEQMLSPKSRKKEVDAE